MTYKDIKRKLKLDSDLFFAYTGTIEPRKNINRLIEGFEFFNDLSEEKYFLVLAGKLGWKTKPIVKAINNSRYREYIIMPGYINSEEKIFLMKNSAAFVFPSNYEGFGIPVIEAMSSGGIVITADNSSLAEIGGEASIYTEANDGKSIAEAMSRCVNMLPEERQRRIRIGKEWASRFTWETCSRKTQSLLEE